VFVVAGDNLPSAVDNQQQYRPHEIPGNSQITYGAGDAVGILLGLEIVGRCSECPDLLALTRCVKLL
jgi:hypothetical protein